MRLSMSVFWRIYEYTAMGVPQKETREKNESESLAAAHSSYHHRTVKPLRQNSCTSAVVSVSLDLN